MKYDITRRQFVRKSFIGTFGILSADSANSGNSGTGLSVGLIGCGGRGTGALFNLLSADPSIRVNALADVFKPRIEFSAQQLLEKKNVRVPDDAKFVGLDAYKSLLKTDVDIVIHATCAYARPEHIEAAVAAGKHLFVEKPAAVDPVGVRRFIAAAQAAKSKGLTLVSGLQRRYQGAYQETVKRLQDGFVGEILSCEAFWWATLPFCRERESAESDLAYRIRNWCNYCWTGGDSIVDAHVHNLDVINWVLDEPPVRVTAKGGRGPRQSDERYGDIFEYFDCEYEYACGVKLISGSRWSNDKDKPSTKVYEKVIGSKGESNCRDLIQSSDLDPYVEEHRMLLQSIQGGQYINDGVRHGESTLTAIMGRMAAYSGKAVTWDEAFNSQIQLVPGHLDWSKSYPVGPVPAHGI